MTKYKLRAKETFETIIPASEIKERLQRTLGKNNVVINITPFVSVEDLYD